MQVYGQNDDIPLGLHCPLTLEIHVVAMSTNINLKVFREAGDKFTQTASFILSHLTHVEYMLRAKEKFPDFKLDEQLKDRITIYQRYLINYILAVNDSSFTIDKKFKTNLQEMINKKF